MARNNKNTEDDIQYPLVAVDFGSSGIRVMAAEPNKDGTLTILGVEPLEKYGFVEKGVVTQSTDASNHLKRQLKFLTNRCGLPFDSIDRAFVCVGDKLLQVITTSSKRDFVSANYISPNILKSMETECIEKITGKYEKMAIVSIVPLRYFLDGIEQTKAPEKTQKARMFEVEYQLFVCQKTALEHLQGSFGRAGMAIEYQWSRPDALVTALTGDKEREEGVAIIDFGAQTTTLSIYKGDRFLFTYTVLKGGYQISNDIANTFGISFDSAEKLKCRFGIAAPKFVKQERDILIRSSRQEDLLKINLSSVARVIDARLQETLEPLMQIIDDYSSQLKYLYITGGGSMLDSLCPFLRERTSLQVDFGSHACCLSQDAEQAYYMPRYSSLVGTLIMGADHRRESKNRNNVQIPSPIHSVVKFMRDLFTNND